MSMEPDRAIAEAKRFEAVFWRSNFDGEMAKAALEQNGETVAFTGGRRLPSHFVVRFAYESASAGPPLWLTETAARKLCQILVQEGFV